MNRDALLESTVYTLAFAAAGLAFLAMLILFPFLWPLLLMGSFVLTLGTVFVLTALMANDLLSLLSR